METSTPETSTAASTAAIAAEGPRPGHDLRFSRFNEVNLRRSETLWHPLDWWSVSQWTTALSGEVGEAANLLKKINRISTEGPEMARLNDAAAYDQRAAALADEVGDAVTYADLLAARLQINLDQALFRKISRGLRMREKLALAEGHTFGELRRLNLTRWTALYGSPALQPPDYFLLHAQGAVGRLATHAIHHQWSGTISEFLMPHQEEQEGDLVAVILALDLLAFRIGFETGEAVVTKFNRLSQEKGYPEVL